MGTVHVESFHGDTSSPSVLGTRPYGRCHGALHYARAISTAAAIGHARVLVKHAAGLNRRAALLRSGVRAAPSPPAAAALADDLLNTLGAGTAAGRA